MIPVMKIATIWTKHVAVEGQRASTNRERDNHYKCDELRTCNLQGWKMRVPEISTLRL